MFKKSENTIKIVSLKNKNSQIILPVIPENFFLLLPKELIKYIAAYLMLRDFFAFALTNKINFKLIKQTEVEDPYPQFIFLSINEHQTLTFEKLHGISKQYNNLPILIRIADQICLYGKLNEEWNLIDLKASNSLKRSLHYYFLENSRFTEIIPVQYWPFILIKEFLFENRIGIYHNKEYLTVLWKDKTSLLHKKSLAIKNCTDLFQLLNWQAESKDKNLINLIRKYFDCEPAIAVRKFNLKLQIDKDKVLNKLIPLLKTGHSSSIKFTEVLKRNNERLKRLSKIAKLEQAYSKNLGMEISSPPIDINKAKQFADAAFILSLVFVLLGLSLLESSFSYPEPPCAFFLLSLVLYYGNRVLESSIALCEKELLESENANSPNPLRPRL